MLQTIVRICQIAFLVLATAALAWWLGGKLGGGPRRLELDPFQRTLAEKAVLEVVAELPRREDVRKLVVPPVVGDLDGRVTDLLVDAVRDDDRYEVVRPSSVEDAIKEDLKGKIPATREDVLKLAKKLVAKTQADGVLYATVARDSGQKGLGAEVDLQARLIRLKDEAEVPGGLVRSTHRIESRASLDYFAPFMEQVHPLWRMFLWLLFTAGLPFAAFPIVQAVTAKENNRLNALLLGGLVACDVVFGAALFGFRPGWFGVFVLVVAGFAAFIYDFAICDKIDDMRN